MISYIISRFLNFVNMQYIYILYARATQEKNLRADTAARRTARRQMILIFVPSSRHVLRFFVLQTTAQFPVASSPRGVTQLCADFIDP